MSDDTLKREVERHNEVTRTIIVGLLCDHEEEGLSPSATSRLIMDLLNRRGYEPQIISCNQLWNGDSV